MQKKLIILFIMALVFSFAINNSIFAAEKDSPIKIFKLASGQTVVIKEVHTNPIVSVDTWVKTGSVNENNKNNGVSHFLEHLIFKGTKKYKAGEIDRILESKGANYNASTSKDFTHFYTTTASQYAPTVIELQSDMLMNATIPPDELARERKVVQEEIRRSEDSPDRIVYDNLNNLLFKSHPYKYETLGPISNIENISREEILDYYHHWYVPSNMITVVVGDVDTNKILALIKEKYNSANNHYVTSKYQREPELASAGEKIEKGNFNVGYLDIGFKGVPITDKKDGYALDLAASILGDGRSSRLYQDIKEKNLVSSIEAGHMSMRDDSIFYIGANLQPENYAPARVAIIKELDKMRTEKVTEQELKRAKTQLARQFLYNSESVENIANTIGYCMTIGGSLDYYTNYINNINKMTAADIQRAVDKYISNSKMATSVLFPENSTYAVSNKQDFYKNTAKTVLNNGMVLVTDKNSSNDIVSMSVFIKGGNLIETSPGLTDVIASSLMKGTTNKSALEISNELENSGIVISPIANQDYFEIQLKSTTQDFEKGLEILADIVNNPAFKNEYVEKAKTNILESIQESRDTPVSYAFEKFTAAMYPNHPYGYEGAIVEKSLPSLKRDDVVKFYNDYFIPENMVVSVSGNIDTQDIANKLYAYFPKKQGKIIDVNSLKTDFKPLSKNQVVSVKKDTAAAWMVMGWPTSGITENKDFTTLRIINSILGDGLSSRLFVNLREKQGLAYVVTSTYPTRLDNSFFVLYIGTKPENVEVAKDNFIQEVNKIKTQTVSETELNEAKQKLIGQFALSQETNQQKAHYLGFFEMIGKGYKYNFDYPDTIKSVTSEDVLRIANKYFNNPYIISLVAPAKQVESLEKGNYSESKR